MKTQWSWMSALLGLSLIIFFACQNDELESLDNNGSVSFNVSSNIVSENGGNSARTLVEPGTCDMELASYAIIEVDEVVYTLDIQHWGEEYKTDLLELDPGTYTLTSFVVFDAQDNPLFATPTDGSEFGKFVDRPLPMEFEVVAYQKLQNLIDVLCIEDFVPPNFGFDFWNIDLKSTKNLYVFVNYCEEDYGHLVAALTAEVYPSAGQTDPEDLIWTGSVGGAGELLGIRFPYDPDIPVEEQSYYVVLYINGIEYFADINLSFIDEINASETGYLHLNENCHGDIEPFHRIVQLAFEDLLSDGNDMDYNDLIVGFDITGNGETLTLNMLPMARGAGYQHRFELVFMETEIGEVTGPGVSIREEPGMRVVVLCDETTDVFGGSFVNVYCAEPQVSFSPMTFEIEVLDDFVYYFDRPLKPCMHTIPGQTPVYNVFLWDWNGDGQSTFMIGEEEYPNGLVIPKDWTQGQIWKQPIEGHSILAAYDEFGPLPLTPNWFDGPVNISNLYPDGCIP